jgi:peptide chain release factor 1
MLHEGLKRKLRDLKERHEEVGHMISDPAVLSDANKFKALNKEFSQLDQLMQTTSRYENLLQNQSDTEALAKGEDADMRELAREELPAIEAGIEACEVELKTLLVPRDPMDEANLFLEVRAGTGGDEAAIFAGDLFRMYSRYAESCRWKVEVMSASEGEHGGFAR